MTKSNPLPELGIYGDPNRVAVEVSRWPEFMVETRTGEPLPTPGHLTNISHLLPLASGWTQVITDAGTPRWKSGLVSPDGTRRFASPADSAERAEHCGVDGPPAILSGGAVAVCRPEPNTKSKVVEVHTTDLYGHPREPIPLGQDINAERSGAPKLAITNYAVLIGIPDYDGQTEYTTTIYGLR